MNLEQILQAKQNYYGVSAILQLVGGMLLFIPTGLFAVVGYGRLQKDSSDIFGIFLTVLAFVGLLFSAIMIPLSIHELATAEAKARAEVANYQLIEIRK